MKKLFCFLFGHKVVSGLYEDSEIIADKGCKRCGVPIIGRHTVWKGIRAVPPPGGDAADWGKYCDETDNMKRKEFAV